MIQVVGKCCATTRFDKHLIELCCLILAFIGGVLVSEGSYSLEKMAEISGKLVTIFTLVAGIRIFLVSYRYKDYMIAATIVVIWLANIAFSFALFQEPIEDMLFDVATFMTMLALGKKSFREVHRGG